MVVYGSLQQLFLTIYVHKPKPFQTLKKHAMQSLVDFELISIPDLAGPKFRFEMSNSIANGLGNFANNHY